MGTANAISADLIAVLVAVTAGCPRVLTIRDGLALPSGRFEPGHRSLQAGLRAWVEQQTRHPLGYVEQLYTFADGERISQAGHRAISISYLGLTRQGSGETCGSAIWHDWYRYFPWEDHRGGRPEMIELLLGPRLRGWADAPGERAARHQRGQRIAINFGLNGHTWNDELVLQRYELLYEAGLVAAAGKAMEADHRRILATGIARLRAKIRYHPVVFELMPPDFTLLQLQRSVEGIAGRLIHKQNFRRLIEQQALVEETGEIATATGGRPAKLFRFRRQVLDDRAVAGAKLPVVRA